MPSARVAKSNLRTPAKAITGLAIHQDQAARISKNRPHCEPGDTVIGRDTNVGCSVITVNYNSYDNTDGNGDRSSDATPGIRAHRSKSAVVPVPRLRHYSTQQRARRRSAYSRHQQAVQDRLDPKLGASAITSPAATARPRAGARRRGVGGRCAEIVGYVGPRQAYPPCSAASKTAQISAHSRASRPLGGAGRLEIRRTVGKLENLRRLVEKHPLSGHIGIGRPPWATTGAPRKPTPSPSGQPSVSTGLSKTMSSLRAALAGRGHKLRKRPDTELVSHLDGGAS